ncbi:helix-turn-helix transcriptional regulator [Capnocytophaga sputigena]|jgi:DNA-binding helix-turn-helix protein|uniref:helix-turn-helix domain-containing protein n=1 Tax=Capnocytophaga sputigena TaxID=1019 RepID=UPI00288BFE80|nr:helix-turn-helix transcriptional regulator [Capnocytophaga sputigena]
MEIAQVIERIVQGRNKKGYTYENMAVELDLTTAAYRKIETGETKLTLERLFKISDILEVPVGELLAIEKSVNQQVNNGNSNVYNQKIDHFYQENREITEQLIKAKDELIAQLKQENEYLRAER